MDDDEDRDFSKGIVYGFFEQADGTFDKMEKAMSVWPFSVWSWWKLIGFVWTGRKKISENSVNWDISSKDHRRPLVWPRSRKRVNESSITGPARMKQGPLASPTQKSRWGTSRRRWPRSRMITPMSRLFCGDSMGRMSRGKLTKHQNNFPSFFKKGGGRKNRISFSYLCLHVAFAFAFWLNLSLFFFFFSSLFFFFNISSHLDRLDIDLGRVSFSSSVHIFCPLFFVCLLVIILFFCVVATTTTCFSSESIDRSSESVTQSQSKGIWMEKEGRKKALSVGSWQISFLLFFGKAWEISINVPPSSFLLPFFLCCLLLLLQRWIHTYPFIMAYTHIHTWNNL